MEMGETPEEAVARELFEETKATIAPASLSLYMIGYLPDISEVHLAYRAELISPDCERTDEALEVALFEEQSVPWGETAYPDVMDIMRTFYAEHAEGNYGIYSSKYIGGVHEYALIGTSPRTS